MLTSSSDCVIPLAFAMICHSSFALRLHWQAITVGARVYGFGLGFVRLRVTGSRVSSTDAPIVVSNHVSPVDGLLIAGYFRSVAGGGIIFCQCQRMGVDLCNAMLQGCRQGRYLCWCDCFFCSACVRVCVERFLLLRCILQCRRCYVHYRYCAARAVVHASVLLQLRAGVSSLLVFGFFKNRFAVISKQENFHAPLLKQIMQALQCVAVDRSESTSRNSACSAIHQRVNNPVGYPQVHLILHAVACTASSKNGGKFFRTHKAT
jgi:hypothetical protein